MCACVGARCIIVVVVVVVVVVVAVVVVRIIAACPVAAEGLKRAARRARGARGAISRAIAAGWYTFGVCDVHLTVNSVRLEKINDCRLIYTCVGRHIHAHTRTLRAWC